MGFFSSLGSSLGNIGSSIGNAFADPNFTDRLDGIGQALQGDQNAYENYTKRKSQRQSGADNADGITALAQQQSDAANAAVAAQTLLMPAPSPSAPVDQTGTVQMPTPAQAIARLQPNPNLPQLGAPRTFLRRF